MRALLGKRVTLVIIDAVALLGPPGDPNEDLRVRDAGMMLSRAEDEIRRFQGWIDACGPWVTGIG